MKAKRKPIFVGKWLHSPKKYRGSLPAGVKREWEQRKDGWYCRLVAYDVLVTCEG